MWIWERIVQKLIQNGCINIISVLKNSYDAKHNDEL